MEIYIRRENRKNVQIKVYSKEVVVFAPLNLPLKRIKELVEARNEWVQSRLTMQISAPKEILAKGEIAENLNTSQNESLNRQYSCKEILLFGIVHKVMQGERKKTYAQDGYVYVNSAETYEKRRNECKKLLKAVCTEKLLPLASVIFAKMGVCPCGITVRNIQRVNYNDNNGIQSQDSHRYAVATNMGDTASNLHAPSCISVFDWACIEKSVVYFDAQVVQLPAILQKYIVASVGATLLNKQINSQYAQIVRHFSLDIESAEEMLTKYSYLKDLF